ncbi:MAG: DNA (cytosine-5-)-methyltransferase [Gemmatimonadaceae bacterium]|nr:DNA (cytosine-5-)-methyltransferase [Gemmatimonadaceae bacterium]
MPKKPPRNSAAKPAVTVPAREIRQLRESLGVTQAELAEVLEYSTREFARWETGEVVPRQLVIERLRQLAAGLRGPSQECGRYSFVDLFAGIGGMRLGFEQVSGGQAFRCVFTSEWDRFCRQTYYERFGRSELIRGDIRNIASSAIPEHDVLVAGFPCQPFSLAGVSKKNSLGRPHGFDCNTQGTLVVHIERILSERRPRAFVLENVKNLLSHDSGRTWDVIREVLEHRLDYRIEHRVVDARSLLPQHRERIFIVGFRREEKLAFDWDDVALPDSHLGPRLDRVLHPEDGSEAGDPRFLEPDGSVHPRYVLSDHLWEYLQSYARKHREKGNGFGFTKFGPGDVARTLSARYHKDGSEILIERASGNPRRLTPRECARLMGFDPLLPAAKKRGSVRPSRIGRESLAAKSDRRPFPIVVSDTQAYRQFGNAVAVPVVARIADSLARHLDAETGHRGSALVPPTGRGEGRRRLPPQIVLVNA